MRDHREISCALKRKEKIGLKLGLEMREKLKFFKLTFTVFSFFESLWKSDCVISFKSRKNCYFLKKALKLFTRGMRSLPSPPKPGMWKRKR